LFASKLSKSPNLFSLFRVEFRFLPEDEGEKYILLGSFRGDFEEVLLGECLFVKEIGLKSICLVI